MRGRLIIVQTVRKLVGFHNGSFPTIFFFIIAHEFAEKPAKIKKRVIIKVKRFFELLCFFEEVLTDD